jgi:acyl-CoA thioester hydrolase
MSADETVLLTGHFWGSVNTWECDENDHQNVRFYAHKALQAMQSWAVEMSGRVAAVERVARAIRRQHIRFLAEARAATPVRVEVGALSSSSEGLTLLAVMRHNATDQPLAAFTSVLDAQILGDLLAGLSPIANAAAPDFAQARGLPGDLPRAPTNLANALSAGYRVVGRGVIGGVECQADGLLSPWGYIGRVSDGMPNLAVILSTPEEREARESNAIGGAALEYRLEILEPLARDDVFIHLSGVSAIADKTQRMAHVLINARTGTCAMQAAAIGVSMDLVTRRAIAIPEARRARLAELMLRLD